MKTESIKTKIQITDETKNKILINQLIVNERFMSRLSKKYNPMWFGVSSDTNTMLIHELVDWYKKTGKIPTTSILVSSVNQKNQKNPIPQFKIDEMVRMYNESKSFDTSSFTKDDLAGFIHEHLKTKALKANMLEVAMDIETKPATVVVEKVLQDMEDLSKIVLDDEQTGSAISKGNLSCFDSFVDWVKNPSARVLTGFEKLDEALNGGLMKDGKSLYIFMAQTGLGKSNILANIAINLMKQNLNPLIVSLEMSENVYQKRLYSVMTDVPIDELGTHIEVMRERVVDFFNSHDRAGFVVKEFPVKGVSSRDIKDYVERLDKKPDVLLVDYLNLLKTNESGKNVQMYEEGLRISEDLRAVSQELEIPIITAVQSNTEGMNSDEISLKNISQSRGIAHTADFIGILYKSQEERDNEKANGKGIVERLSLKIEKSRFGVAGNTIDIAYNNRTLSMCDYEKVQHLVSTISTNKPEEKADCDSFLDGMFEGLNNK